MPSPHNNDSPATCGNNPNRTFDATSMPCPFCGAAAIHDMRRGAKGPAATAWECGSNVIPNIGMVHRSTHCLNIAHGYTGREPPSGPTDWYAAWKRALEDGIRAERALQEELTDLLVLLLDARLEHTCRRTAARPCPECKLAAHIRQRGWDDIESIKEGRNPWRTR